MQDHDNGWRFLSREQEAFDESAIRSYVEGKRVLITGAGGFIGSALARSLCQLSVKHLSLLDIAESGLRELALDLDRDSAVSRDLIVGDICDAAMLTDIFKRHRPQIVLHAAACKHVSLMEENPDRNYGCNEAHRGTRCIGEPRCNPDERCSARERAWFNRQRGSDAATSDLTRWSNHPDGF